MTHDTCPGDLPPLRRDPLPRVLHVRGPDVLRVAGPRAAVRHLQGDVPQVAQQLEIVLYFLCDVSSVHGQVLVPAAPGLLPPPVHPQPLRPLREYSHEA